MTPWYLDCGHLNWYSDDANAAAVARGNCCLGGEKKHPISWQQLKGAFIRPLPPHLRRSFDRERMGGFPGYCCDDEGNYIGGIGNDCRYDSPDERRCVIHSIIPKSKLETEPDAAANVDEADEADLVPQDEVPTPALKPSGGSWKQRQLSAKRGRR
ncbi:MAG: hypothetical protein EBT79_12695 [Actinobacteria bacterium]|nr:hypothetical protein [Actinomycetota bacterium]